MSASFMGLIAAVEHCHECRRGKWSYLYTDNGIIVLEDFRRSPDPQKLCITVSPEGECKIESFMPIIPTRAFGATASK